MTACAWVLNFNADDELADPSARTQSRAALERARALAERPSIRALLGPGDIVVSDPSDATHLIPGLAGRAWCPTPHALEILARIGAAVPAAPPFEVLRRVNHRRFSFDLGRALPGAAWATTRAEVDAALAAPSPTGRWLLRRPFGFAGRGRLRLDPSRRDAAADRWIDASLAADGIEVAPWVDRLADFAVHGHLAPDGALVLGAPTLQRCDDTGAWLDSARAAPGDLADPERADLLHEAHRAAAALHAAGYFGPFGLDAFRYRDEAGAARFDPRCEINARYSMGWTVGMGELRPDLR